MKIDLSIIYKKATEAAKKATQDYIQEELYGDSGLGCDGTVLLILHSFNHNNTKIDLCRHKSFVSHMLTLGAIRYPDCLLGIRISNPSKIDCKSRIAKYKGARAAQIIWNQSGFNTEIRSATFKHQIY